MPANTNAFSEIQDDAILMSAFGRLMADENLRDLFLLHPAQAAKHLKRPLNSSQIRTLAEALKAVLGAPENRAQWIKDAVGSADGVVTAMPGSIEDSRI